MNIPRHWSRARRRVEVGDRVLDLSAWGWSSESRLHAHGRAEERLAVLVDRARSGQPLQAYPYGVRPLREEIVDELRDPGGDLLGIVTRNGYGSLVLNTEQALFIDVDVAGGGGGLLGRLFGRATPAEAALARLRTVLADRAGSFRVYRTAGGYRVLGTTAGFPPKDAGTDALMRDAGADPAYRQLCAAQQTFRARLTPKPWRCGARTPPGEHPREDAAVQAAFVDWRADYERKAETRATCSLVETIGDGRVDRALRPVVDLHDRMTRALETLPLA